MVVMEILFKSSTVTKDIPYPIGLGKIQYLVCCRAMPFRFNFLVFREINCFLVKLKILEISKKISLPTFKNYIFENSYLFSAVSKELKILMSLSEVLLTEATKILLRDFRYGQLPIN